MARTYAVALGVVCLLLASMLNGCQPPGMAPPDEQVLPPSGLPAPAGDAGDQPSPPAAKTGAGPAKPPPVSVEIESPTTGGQVTVKCEGGPGFFDVSGTSRGVAGKNRKILLYVNPHEGGSGWYLQIPGHTGVSGVAPDDGRWEGSCQLGNAAYPPRNGDPDIGVAAVVMSAEDAARAVAAGRENPDGPVFELPSGLAQDQANDVRLNVIQ